MSAWSEREMREKGGTPLLGTFLITAFVNQGPAKGSLPISPDLSGLSLYQVRMTAWMKENGSSEDRGRLKLTGKRRQRDNKADQGDQNSMRRRERGEKHDAAKIRALHDAAGLSSKGGREGKGKKWR